MYFVLFYFNDSTFRFLPGPLTLAVSGNLLQLLHAGPKSSFDNFKYCSHFKISFYLVSSLLCLGFLGFVIILAIDYLFEVLKSHSAQFFCIIMVPVCQTNF